jgi:hypothetical protein
MVKPRDGSGFTDDLIKLMMAIVKVDDAPGAGVCALPVEWVDE